MSLVYAKFYLIRYRSLQLLLQNVQGSLFPLDTVYNVSAIWQLTKWHMTDIPLSASHPAGGPNMSARADMSLELRLTTKSDDGSFFTTPAAAKSNEISASSSVTPARRYDGRLCQLVDQQVEWKYRTINAASGARGRDRGGARGPWTPNE